MIGIQDTVSPLKLTLMSSWRIQGECPKTPELILDINNCRLYAVAGPFCVKSKCVGHYVVSVQVLLLGCIGSGHVPKSGTWLSRFRSCYKFGHYIVSVQLLLQTRAPGCLGSGPVPKSNEYSCFRANRIPDRRTWVIALYSRTSDLPVAHSFPLHASWCVS